MTRIDFLEGIDTLRGNGPNLEFESLPRAGASSSAHRTVLPGGVFPSLIGGADMGVELPFMPFFVYDWLSDEAVIKMSITHQGAYLRLLFHQWVEGSIPATTAELAGLLFGDPEGFPPWHGIHDALRGADRSDPNISGEDHWGALTDGRWSDHFERWIWPPIKCQFLLHDDGRLRNQKLAKIRQDLIDKTERVSASRAAAGSKGGKQKASNCQAKGVAKRSKMALALKDGCLQISEASSPSSSSMGSRGGANGVPRAEAAEAIAARDLRPEQVEVVEFYATQFCMSFHAATEAVVRLGVEVQDLGGWRRALESASSRGLNDYRSYIRSRAKLFRTAAEAFGISSREAFANFDWAKFLEGADQRRLS